MTKQNRRFKRFMRKFLNLLSVLLLAAFIGCTSVEVKPSNEAPCSIIVPVLRSRVLPAEPISKCEDLPWLRFKELDCYRHLINSGKVEFSMEINDEGYCGVTVHFHSTKNKCKYYILFNDKKEVIQHKWLCDDNHGVGI
jgi:hypothetical protein